MPPPGFDELSVEQKIEYVQDLWDHITADADKVAVPTWQKEIIDHRMAELDAKPDSLLPWQEVRERLGRSFGSQTE